MIGCFTRCLPLCLPTSYLGWVGCCTKDQFKLGIEYKKLAVETSAFYVSPHRVEYFSVAILCLGTAAEQGNAEACYELSDLCFKAEAENYELSFKLTSSSHISNNEIGNYYFLHEDQKDQLRKELEKYRRIHNVDELCSYYGTTKFLSSPINRLAVWYLYKAKSLGFQKAISSYEKLKPLLEDSKKSQESRIRTEQHNAQVEQRNRAQREAQREREKREAEMKRAAEEARRKEERARFLAEHPEVPLLEEQNRLLREIQEGGDERAALLRKQYNAQLGQLRALNYSTFLDVTYSNRE